MIKDVLKTLRLSKSVLVKNHGIIFVYDNVKDVEGQILRNIKNGDMK